MSLFSSSETILLNWIPSSESKYAEDLILASGFCDQGEIFRVESIFLIRKRHAISSAFPVVAHSRPVKGYELLHGIVEIFFGVRCCSRKISW